MGIMKGGPLNGQPAGKAIIELGSRYNSVCLQDDKDYPTAIYERIRGTDDFQWVVTCASSEESGNWFARHNNEWNYF